MNYKTSAFRLAFNFPNRRYLRIVLLVFSLLQSHSAICAEERNLACHGCNVVFINLDFLRTDYLGLTSGSGLTPNIDRYFGNSIIFNNAYATAGSTYRGNLSVFTSTTPHYYSIDVLSFSRLKSSGNLGPWKQIFLARKSFAEILTLAGYYTANINKGRRSGRSTLLDRGYTHYQDRNLKTLIQDLIPRLKRQVEQINGSTFVHLHAIPTRLHKAYYPVNRPRDLNRDIIYQAYNRNGKPYGYTVISNYRVGVVRRRNAEHAIYRQQLKYADEQLLKLFAALKQIESNTLVVLFSTHGTQIGDNGIFASDGTGFESNIRVPLLIKHPAITTPIRISQRVSMLDLMPTLLEMLGIETAGLDGVSLLPVIHGRRYPRPTIWGKNDKDDFVIKGDWKLLRYHNYERKLFKIDHRPQRNIYMLNKNIARILEFVDSPGITKTRTLSDGVHELYIKANHKTLLFNLRGDPHETSDLSQLQPDIVEKLGAILDARQQDAANRIADVLKNQTFDSVSTNRR